MPDVGAALAAFARVLRPGGLLVATVAQAADVQPFYGFLSQLAEGGFDVPPKCILFCACCACLALMCPPANPQFSPMTSSPCAPLPLPCRALPGRLLRAGPGALPA